MIKRICLLAIFIGGIWGCSEEPEKPEDLISEGKYVSLLVEMQLVRSYGENAKTDSTTIDSLTSEVYTKYAVTEEQFDKTHNYYQHYPKEQKKRVDRAIEQLKQELVTKEDTTVKADTVRRAQ